MGEDFRRTLQTAADAEGVAALLGRAAAAGGKLTVADSHRLAVLAERYREYAASLREMVLVPTDEPEQPALGLAP